MLVLVVLIVIMAVRREGGGAPVAASGVVQRAPNSETHGESWSVRPALHVSRDAGGLLLPTRDMPRGILDCTRAYFAARLEDEEAPAAAAAA